jgi:DNA helicase-2/ATP-dependent DNA helicase PcrA
MNLNPMPANQDPLPSSDPVFLEELNPPQRQAATTLDGAVLVLAAAGTGKTRALTARIAYILSLQKARPSEILAVTFTNKAAMEMRHRITKLIGPSSEAIWLGTFHSVCVRILRRHAPLIGLEESFTILDTDDQMRLIKQILQAENLDDKKFPPRMVLQIISRWKDRGLLPAQAPGDQTLYREIYTRYQDRLKILNAVDFGDLMLNCLTLFTRHPEVLHQYQQQFKYIMVDEYQDTNVAQYLWLRLLAQGGACLCCVGDDDQSIYGWRGAEVANILRFEKDFSPACVIRLEQNYRSTPHILGAASGLICHNQERLGKTMWTDLDQGEKVNLLSVWDSEEEVSYIGDEIEAYQRRGHPLSSMAILVRAGFQTREFEDQFIKMAIPYRVVGGPRFYERLEIRDALAYLRLVVHRYDGLAFERVLNTPRRGIGSATLQVLHELARRESISLVEAAYELLETDELKPQVRRTLGGFLAMVDRWRRLPETHSPSEIAKVVLDESGYTAMLQADPAPDAPGRLENLKEFVGALEEFESLSGFLEHVSLVMDNGRRAGEEGVSLMTLHSAKGLEFDFVFLPGWEEGIFPNPRSLGELGASALEEERRLAYVGLTRARIQATISHAANRRIYNTWQSSVPSRFIAELPEDHVEVVGGGRGSRFGGRSISKNQALSFNSPGGGSSVSKVPTGKEGGGSSKVRIGQRVFHQKFGYGTVEGVDGDRLSIDFEKAGAKKVLFSFVTLVRS